ncbi:hypothetical protein [Pseudonocardia sp. WMMC193]|uniref:hypothetical protein n=1 Tax=Pseudonocardia sp. WMMC193 TaxID=2911965 RepID=UPI001F228E1C|nr:hypothetical protein [Pseudonocardia sp. WMMC193]MCF7553824.1 hypothetical protein [Pseudonocardia sp. WMMC193]
MRNRSRLVLPEIEPATQLLGAVPTQKTPEIVADYLGGLPAVRTSVDRRRDPLTWIAAAALGALLITIVVLSFVLF